MGNIRNFKGIRRAVLNFDYYWSKGRFLCYRILQMGGVMLFPFVLILRFKEYCKGDSYWPECARKSTFRIFMDQIGWIFRKGELNNFYYMLGMDRKDAGNIYEYVGEITWTNARRKKNEVKRQWKFFSASALLLDKYYFGALLESLGYKTPRIRFLINDGVVRDLDRKCETTFASIFLNGDCRYFFKRAAGGGGKDVDNFVVKMQEGKLFRLNEETTVDSICESVKRGRWIVQEKLEGQHKDMAKYHEASINTVRMVTVNQNGSVFPIAALARFGQGGRMKDNGFSGGIIVPINIIDGSFAEYGLMPVQKKRVRLHPDSGLPFAGGCVPMWKTAVAKATELHKQFYNIHSVGWDIAFLQDDVCFIEGNDNWHVVDAQVYSPGRPIFRKYFK